MYARRQYIELRNSTTEKLTTPAALPIDNQRCELTELLNHGPFSIVMMLSEFIDLHTAQRARRIGGYARGPKSYR